MNVQTVSPNQLRLLHEQGAAPRIIDVRTPAEFAAVHAEGAASVPLDRLNPAEVIALGAGTQQPLYLICKSGQRAAKAAGMFTAAGFSNVFCVEGGTTAWEQAGLPIVRGTIRVISLERQVRVAAGSLTLIGVTLGWFVHPAFLGVAMFVGTGLVFAGVTDWCGMGLLLAKMPWNHRGV
jgi:rhodanese-related sulfurtransferase